MVRIFNTYGPRMRPHDGRAIPTFMRQALQDRPITVFGDGSQTRSFCFVSDLIDGIIRLAESGLHYPVNIGNPNEFTLLELAQQVIEITGSRSEIVHEALPTDDPQVRQPDISLAREKLGWEPKVELREGLAAHAGGVRRRGPHRRRLVLAPPRAAWTASCETNPCPDTKPRYKRPPAALMGAEADWLTHPHRPRTRPSGPRAACRGRAVDRRSRPSTSAARSRRCSPSCCGWRRCAGPSRVISLLALDFAALYAAIFTALMVKAVLRDGDWAWHASSVEAQRHDRLRLPGDGAAVRPLEPVRRARPAARPAADRHQPVPGHARGAGRSPSSTASSTRATTSSTARWRSRS